MVKNSNDSSNTKNNVACLYSSTLSLDKEPLLLGLWDHIKVKINWVVNHRPMPTIEDHIIITADGFVQIMMAREQWRAIYYSHPV